MKVKKEGFWLWLWRKSTNGMVEYAAGGVVIATTFTVAVTGQIFSGWYWCAMSGVPVGILICLHGGWREWVEKK